MTAADDFYNYVPRFDLERQALSLDFANTMDWHASTHPVEGLNTYADLAAWSFEAGFVSAEEAAALAAQSQEQPEQAHAALADAVALRDSLYRLFVASARGTPLDPGDLSVLSRFWGQAARYMRLVPVADGAEWDWDIPRGDLRSMLWRVTKSAVELLQSDLRERIGQCDDDRGCGFLFLDTSRNRTRRWCSMESCGNRAKANRHYQREKKK